MNRFNRWVVDHPWPTIAVFLLVTVWLAMGFSRLHVNTDIRSMMPQEHPVFLYNEWVEDYFAIEDPAVIAVINDGGDGVFTPPTLRLVKHISEAMAALESIDGDDLISLSAVDNITGEGDVLSVDLFFEKPPSNAQEARALRVAVFENPMMVGTVVSKDGHATAIMGEMYDGYDKVELYADLLAIVAASPVTTERVIIAGQPVIEGEISTLMRSDLALMFPFVIASTALLLFVALRLIRAAVLPLLVVVTSVVWTVGLMGWTKSSFFAISSLIPILLVAIGVAAGIHIIHTYLLSVATHPTRRAADTVFETMQKMTRPVVMTSITTAAGISSLAVSPLRPIQSLGIFTAFGVMAAMVFSMTILPAILSLLPLPLKAARRARRAEAVSGGTVSRLVRMLSALVVGRPRLVMAASVLIGLISLSALPRITADGSMLQNFPVSSVVNLADREFVKYFGGSIPIQIVLEGGDLDAWKDPSNLRAVEGLQRHIEKSGHTEETRSIVDYIRRMNAVMNPDDPAGYRVPDSQELVAQYLLLYSLSGEPDDFDDVVDYNYKQANIRAQIDSDHSPVVQRVIQDVDSYASEHLAPLGIKTTVSGTAQIMATFVDLIITGQVRSLLLGVFLIACLTGFMCRSIIGGLVTVLPVAVAILLNFGLLGMSGEPLTVTIALMSSMALGIGVDYAIHFVIKYQNERRQRSCPVDALTRTLSTVGVAIFYNALVVFAGFLVLAMSNFPPHRVLGLLVALNMLVCFVGTVTLLAAVLHWFQPDFVSLRLPREGTRRRKESLKKAA